ncbi:MAG: hypothetical protein AVDCRST_MAG87-3189 [uncultured Thermomicrobiales bacterium]|uniref:Uncharacterized protein n=1 Tax=uncultured Thermomicrobiales bacterium TaxID=1645740 RepID=A0A6J4VIX7_9BACT|nr:MAG: hypothetical protein AVDCRST_MAG87-3189 [uncultured Thermomicrobiales bacterium]
MIARLGPTIPGIVLAAAAGGDRAALDRHEVRCSSRGQAYESTNSVHERHR